MSLKLKEHNTAVSRSYLARFILCGIASLLAMSSPAQNDQSIALKNAALQLGWKQTKNGYTLYKLSVKQHNGWKDIPAPLGSYTLLYSKEKPDSVPVTLYDDKGNVIHFPEQQYHYITPVWKQSTIPVEMNTAGEAIHFYPSSAKQMVGNALLFTQENAKATITSVWNTDDRYTNDITVTITVTAKQGGYYSIATPTLASLDKHSFNWATVPGVFQGNFMEKNFINAFAYGQGIPVKPVVVRERSASTLSPLVTTKDNITIAVIPSPGTGRDPWSYDTKTQSDWQIGLSVLNRKAELMPTAYHPVLGEKGSYLRPGDSVSFSFRFTIQPADWYTVFKHAVNDIYRFNDFLALKQTKRSLTDRILGMHRYVADDSLSKWRMEDVNGTIIGAQDYLGGVYGSEKDAIKNSDYGAMWMLANISNDSILKKTRLPYARNFKLMQQHSQHDFFYGAAAGQYYLYKSKRFTEEWGPYSEPVGSTYYMMMDIGNVLLFEPTDTALKNELRIAADKLLSWMDHKGQWQVAYDNVTAKPLFTDVEDLRPTFYGVLIAYKLLQDPKYLAAAKKGADWFITNAVNKGRFLGVCGDTRFVADFATGQSVQALLDLYDMTKEEKYKTAAIATAKIYTASIYTHPIPTSQQKIVNGIPRADWEISQAGLSFEHGGILGSANHRGPILLASHAGMFVRLYSITGDSLFLNMARAAALGRDAFVDPKTDVASYYWDVMNKGAGPYPHHAWWQIGWITDYLLSEAEMRSHGQVIFPGGFITPKVGPHKTYGFEAGTVYGTKADLLLKEGMLKVSSPYVDYYTAINTRERKLFVILLNDDDAALQAEMEMDYAAVITGQDIRPSTVTVRNDKGDKEPLNAAGAWTIGLPAYGIRVVEISY